VSICRQRHLLSGAAVIVAALPLLFLLWARLAYPDRDLPSGVLWTLVGLIVLSAVCALLAVARAESTTLFGPWFLIVCCLVVLCHAWWPPLLAGSIAVIVTLLALLVGMVREPGARGRHMLALVLGALSVLICLAIVAGATWFLQGDALSSRG
jgi:hypothetical protein